MPSIMTALTFEGIRRAKVRVTTEIKSLCSHFTLRYETYLNLSLIG